VLDSREMRNPAPPPREKTSRDWTAGLVLPVTAIAFAIAIFIIDTFTPLGIAVAALYVVVVLMAGRFLQRRGVLWVASACIALTVLSYVIQHWDTYGPSLVRCLVSLVAIVITTFLALKSQTAGLKLREQANLLETTHDAIIVRDLNDVITFWNRGAEQLYEWPSEEAIGKVSHELLQTVFPASPEELKSALLHADRLEVELTHTKRDGTEVVVASRWSVQRDAAGRPLAILETNNDVTKRKQAEAKNQQQEEELRLTIDSIPTLAWHTAPDGKAEYLSRQWLDYTGLSLERALGWGWSDAIHPDDVDRMLATWEAIRAGGKPASIEARFRQFDGQYRWFLFRCEPFCDEQGNVIRWYGANTDIEDRKKAEEALRRSEANLADAQSLSQTGSFAWDVASGEIRWSDEAYRIFECDQATAPTLDLLLQRTHPDDRSFLQRLLERVGRNRQNWEVEHRLLLPDGSIKHIDVVAHATGDAPDRLEYVGALMDVTDTRLAQEALQRAQAELAHVTRVTTLGELTASIAHEVNQPLAAIVTNGEATLRWLANESPNLAEARGAVERIISDSHRASEVIKRLRELARKSDLQMAALDVNDVIADVVALVQREVLSHRVRLRLELDKTLRPVTGDRVQLQQVLINLLMNGIEAMATVNERPRELVVRSAQRETDRVLVAVRDSGIGIDPERVDRLFMAFVTTKPDGLGMGLSICRSIIEAHGGELWALSNDDAGATFQFTLPIHQERAT
jgi:PAS domain S-box-containing protein